MKKKSTSIIVFAPGLGGNHVANLISLAAGVQPQFLAESTLAYSDQLLEKYRAFRRQVHFDRFDTGNPGLLKLYRDQVLDNPDQLVICCHIRRLFELLNKSFPLYVDYIDVKEIVVILRETHNELAHDRWDWKMTELRDLWLTRPCAPDQSLEEQYRSYMSTQGGHHFDPYNKATYTVDNVIKILKSARRFSDDIKLVEWDPDQIFTDQGHEYIISQAEKDLSWLIPPEPTGTIQGLWIAELRTLINRFKQQPKYGHLTGPR